MPYICLMQNGISSIPKFLEEATKNHYTAVAVAINQNTAPHEPADTDPTYPDIIVASEVWNNKILLMLSDNLDCDSPNEKYREHSLAMMARDKSWADHLQNGGSIMIRLRKENNVCLRELITLKIKGCLMVRVPITNPDLDQYEYVRDKSEEDMLSAQAVDTWHWWYKFHAGCDFDPKVRLVLDINGNDKPSKETVRRWIGEPLDAIIIPSTLFIRNRHNYAVLTREWQNIIGTFLRGRVNVIISTATTDNGLMQYADYMQKMINDYADVHQMQNYEDVLEIPLQPLQDNLDCYTYEVFEKDPQKYKLYQKAIEQALIDRVPEAEIETKLSIIMVLGAGRGPLVRSVFNAAAATKRKVRVYIIEKNTNAIRTISNLVKKIWSDKDIHIFSQDMRFVSPPEYADILVSELLGSFGDNELSPECLDGATKLLKPDGISIPCKSTSYINPIMSAKLLNNTRDVEKLDKHAYDYGYVTLLKNIYNIDEPKELFEFMHPNRAAVINNQRYKKVQFKATMNCIIHGVGGYFDAVLYKDITFSIHPDTHTPGMFSWFPMYFPFRPVKIKKDDIIEIHFWRKVTDRNVWYEWCLTEPINSPTYNHGGCGYIINL